MKEIKFDKKEEESQLIINVELPRRTFLKDPVTMFSNSDMIEYLKESGVKLEEYELSSQPEFSLTSYDDKANDPRLEGTWVFSRKEKKVNKPKPRSYNKSKEKSKTGD